MTTEEKTILKLPLFSAYGIELEYMIVDEKTLNVLPISDKVLHAVAGAYEDEVERGEISWSNELALHVIEFKTSAPVKELNGLYSTFQKHIREVNEILKEFHGKLMPTAMHPWMDPNKEMKLWPHAHNPVYESYHRIFDCRGHGWSNLQSSHINLPFSDDVEFAKLHAAIRTLLPLLPALAASSPIIDGKMTPFLDKRLDVYLTNAKAIPSITGKGIPEVSTSRKHYEDSILRKMYHDIAPFDSEHILQYEWLNSRGAIARFDRYTIEIRILDVQECPVADVAIAELIVGALKLLVAEKWASINQLNELELDSLYNIFLNTIKNGEAALIEDKSYLKAFGLEGKSITAKDFWKYLYAQIKPDSLEKPVQKAMQHILENGPLSRRIKKSWEKDPSQKNLQEIYSKLCHCLEEGMLF